MGVSVGEVVLAAVGVWCLLPTGHLLISLSSVRRRLDNKVACALESISKRYSYKDI